MLDHVEKLIGFWDALVLPPLFAKNRSLGFWKSTFLSIPDICQAQTIFCQYIE